MKVEQVSGLPRSIYALTTALARLGLTLSAVQDAIGGREAGVVFHGPDLGSSTLVECAYRSLEGSSARRRISGVPEGLNKVAGGRRLATSVGGVLTGRGADLIIIDDPQKADDALLESSRRATHTWFDNTLLSRLNNKRDGAIIIVSQRLHQDDLVGHVLQQGGMAGSRLARHRRGRGMSCYRKPIWAPLLEAFSGRPALTDSEREARN